MKKNIERKPITIERQIKYDLVAEFMYPVMPMKSPLKSINESYIRGIEADLDNNNVRDDLQDLIFQKLGYTYNKFITSQNHVIERK